MKKSFRKLIPAILMVLLSASLMGTSTFAWFSMNAKVTVTGMTVRTQLADNLFIAANNLESEYDIALNQTRAGLLEPASTVDGLSFWYTSTANVKADGDAKNENYTEYSEATAITDTNAGKTAYDAGFNTNYTITSPAVGSVAYAYIDYVFYIKATNPDSSAQYLNITKLNLLYDGIAVTEKAWRVAVFAQAAGSAGTESANNLDTALDDSTDLKAILAPDSAVYFTAGKAISENAAPSVDVKQLGSRASIDSIAAKATEYNKVTIRLWLEGEDKTCKNDTFATLTGRYTLDLKFELEVAASTAVNKIGSEVVAVATASTNIGTVTLSDTTSGTIANGETAQSFQWYNAATDAAIDSATGYQYTNADTENAISVYCIVTTDKGNTYRTNIINLAKKTS